MCTESRKTYYKKYYEKNRDKIREHQRRFKISDPWWSEYSDRKEWIRDYRETLYEDVCVYCGNAAEEIDHIDPTAKQGEDDWYNFTASCKECNKRKSDTCLLKYLLTT